MTDKPKKLLFSVTVKDMRRDTFRCPGNGGQKVNKTSAGVRLTHEPSGSSEKSCESRKQAENEQIAFMKLVNSEKFVAWLKIETSRRLGRRSIENTIEEAMEEANLLVEVKDETGRWKVKTQADTPS